MKYVVKLVILGCLFTGCFKKTEVSGFVYSKHGALVPRVDIILYEEKNYVTPGHDRIVATTNANGFYYFKFKMKHNYQYFVRCESDSGTSLGASIRNPKHNDIDLQLR